MVSENRPHRVLVIDEEFAVRPDTGKRQRTLHLLRGRFPRYRVTYLAFVGDDAEEREARDFYEPLGVEVVTVRRPRVYKKGAMQTLTALKVLGRREPASVAAYRSRAFLDAVSRQLADRSYDLIHCEITQMSWAVPFGCGVPAVLDAHNVESVIWQRLAAVSGPVRRLVFSSQAAKMAAFERGVLPRFDHVVCVSEADRDSMRRGYRDGPIDVIANGACLDEPVLPPRRGGAPVILFPGSLNWRPGQDAAQHLVAEVMPELRLACPGVRCLLVGKGPPRWLHDLCAKTTDVACHADVPSMTPYFEQADLVVVPLRVGSGSRLKILEAFAMGRPVVSTPVGAEGLAVRDGVHLDLAAPGAPFAAAVRDLLLDGARRERYIRSGRRYVEEHHAWSRLGDDLDAVWQRLIGDAARA